MPMDQRNVTVFIPAENGETLAPREDVAGILDTFKGYSIFSFHRIDRDRYATRCLTPEIGGGAILPNALLYSPGITSSQANEFNYAVLSNNWQRFANPIPHMISDGYHEAERNYEISTLLSWAVPSLVLSPPDPEIVYYYDAERQRAKYAASGFSFPLLASWDGSPMDNPDVEMEEVYTTRQLNALLDSVENQEPGSEKSLYITEFAPLEPGQLRIWISSLSGETTYIVEEHPRDNYEGSTEGLEQFTQRIMERVKVYAGYNQNHVLVQIDVARSNGYNATEMAKDPGEWVITGIRSPNTSTSVRGPVTPWHFGLPDLTSGTPENPPKFRIY